VSFVAAHFNELVSSSNLSPHPHVILHAGLARSCRIHCSISGGNLLFWEKIPAKRMRGGRKWFFLAPIHCLRWYPSPGGRGLFFWWWILRLRLRLRAEWQCGRHAGKSISFRTRETNRKEICCYEHWFWIDAMSIDFGLMLWALILDWCYVHWFWIDVMCIGIGLMLYASVMDWS